MSSQSQKLKKLNDTEMQLRKQAHLPLTGRDNIEQELQKAEADFKTLEITYEQYFMGIERFEPSKERSILVLRLRRLVNTYIPQTDIRHRLQNLNNRLVSYAAYWDRTLRQIEEGRYQRHISHMKWAAKPVGATPANAPAATAPSQPADPVEKIYRELIAAHNGCQTAPPKREQVAELLQRQAEAIRQRFGDRAVDMTVIVEDGKPKIKVRPKT
jgi:hypothetical protein